MPGADRRNKTNAAGASRKPYTRVRFAQSQTDVAGPSTPPRKRTSPLLDIPQTGMKKRRTDAVRRQSAEHRPPVASFMDDAVTSSLGTRLRARGRMSYPSHSGRMPFDMNPTPGPVRTTKFGMPEKDDFQDFPDVAFLDDVFVAPSPVDLQAKVKELQVALTDQARKYDALEGENRKLKKELGHMKSKYQIIGKMYASAKSAMKQNEGSSHGPSLGNVMICDADDERELPSAAASYTQASVLTSASSLSSASSSSNFRTPSTTPGMPVREIDEDYDEGYDSAALRLAAINDHIIMTSGMNDFDMEIERVAEQLHKRFNLNDNKNDVPARNDVSQAPAFPSLDMPSMPKFFF